jgi:hypothetical protein
LRAGNGDALNRLARQLEVVAIGSFNHQANGNASAFGQQTTLDAAFGAVGGVLAYLFPPQAALWSSRRP